MVLPFADNKLRLRRLHGGAEGGTDAQIDRRILASSSARDLALSRHDIANVRIEVDRGTFRRDDDDATSVRGLVRSSLQGSSCCHLQVVAIFAMRT